MQISIQLKRPKGNTSSTRNYDMNYFVAPRGGEKSYKNYQSTIKNGVPLERIQDFLDEEEIKILSQEEVIYAWGNREGTAHAWERMQDGDLVIFYAQKRLVMTGEVYLKKHSPDLALALWPPDEKGNPWEYVFFLKNLEYISMPIEVFNSAVGYKQNNIIQGFTHLSDERVSGILGKYGSVQKMLSLFTNVSSEEIPLESDKLYVNVPKEIKPVLIESIDLKPRTEVKSSISNKKGPKKIDHVARNKSNSITGSKGEKIVVRVEQDRLREIGKPELARKVDRVSTKDDTLGYDILSFNDDGSERYIEVKASSGNNKTVRFYVSTNEYFTGKEKKNYFIYFVEDVNSLSPKITIIKDPIDESRFLIKPDGFIFEADR